MWRESFLFRMGYPSLTVAHPDTHVPHPEIYKGTSTTKKARLKGCMNVQELRFNNVYYIKRCKRRTFSFKILTSTFPKGVNFFLR